MGFTNATCYHTVDKNVNKVRNAQCHVIAVLKHANSHGHQLHAHLCPFHAHFCFMLVNL